nr:MAG TPA: GrpB protein [Caudoviricetes sp.]
MVTSQSGKGVSVHTLSDNEKRSFGVMPEIARWKELHKSRFHDDVRIVPYQKEWVHRFHTAKELIIALLLTADIECDVRHVGGTAIPGMCSKPIVDVLVMVEERDLPRAVNKLSDEIFCLGECGRLGRYFFSDGDNEHDAVYIHLTTADHQVARDQIAFLALLQSSEEIRREYEELKCRLAEKYPHDRLGYRMEKGVFIENCLQQSEGENV